MSENGHYHTITQDVIPCFQTWINIVQVPLERFTFQLFSELLPLGYVTNIDSMIRCVIYILEDGQVTLIIPIIYK